MIERIVLAAILAAVLTLLFCRWGIRYSRVPMLLSGFGKKRPPSTAERRGPPRWAGSS